MFTHKYKNYISLFFLTRADQRWQKLFLGFLKILEADNTMASIVGRRSNQSGTVNGGGLTLLALMSGNIISPVLQHNGAIVFAGERSLSAEDRKWRKKRIGIKVNLIFSMTKERFFWGGDS